MSAKRIPQEEKARRKREYQRAYRAANPGLATEYSRRLRAVETPEEKERQRAVAREWKARNSERNIAGMKRWREANRDFVLSYARQQAALNKPRRAATQARRRIARITSTPAWADQELIDLIYQVAADRKLEVDHIVPLQGKTVCGLHVHYNLQLLTESENSAKHNKYPYPSRIPLT